MPNVRNVLRIHVIAPVFVALFACLTGFLISGVIGRGVFAGPTTVVDTFSQTYSSGTQNITIPAYAVNITATAYGGGGGGGGSAYKTAQSSRGGGGGGGAYAVKNFNNSQTGGTMAIEVGDRGKRGESSPLENGGKGGDSKVTFGGVTVIAGGGGGGGYGHGNAYGGAGAAGQASNGTVMINGIPGGAGTSNNSGAGGKGAGPLGGNGGAARTSNGNGNAGSSFGGGGSGGMCAMTWDDRPGGYGAAGQVVVSYDVIETVVNINSISANYGPHTGGNTVTITGSGFSAINTTLMDGVNFTSIKFGGVNATNITVINDTTMTLTVPAHSPVPNISTFVNVEFNYTDSYGFVYTQNKTSFYEYRKAATQYTNECFDPDANEWTAYPYVPQNNPTVVNCRVVLDGMYNGNISLFDDYFESIDPGLSGVIASSDSRFSSGAFGLTYANTYSPAAQTLNYTYTPPSSTTLDSFYNPDGSTDDDLYWPLIDLDVTGSDLKRNGDRVVIGLLADAYYILPIQPDDKHCVDCSSTFRISTHGAPYFGTVTLSDDVSNVGHAGGQTGTFTAEGQAGNVVDFSTLDGADAQFTYTPETHTVDPNGYIRLNGTSAGPPITNSYLDIVVLEAGLTITGPANLRRGQTGIYTLEVLIGAAWPEGTVTLSDILSGNGLAGGTFVDITSSAGTGPAGTFDSLTNTYTFYDVALIPGETYIRTFEYTLRDDSVIPPTFPSYLINMTGVMNTQNTTGWMAINVLADKIMFKCTASYPNCTIGYVGELKDYSIGPNGAFVGSANITDNSGGTLGNSGVANWTSSSPFVMSYTPASPGRKVLTATVTSVTNNAAMLGQSYHSNSSYSLNDYIYVMANSMAVTGYEHLSHGQSGNYTLTMNGPFVGTIYLNDTLSGGSSAGGTFSNGGSCTFSLASYDAVTNTSTCSFTYTPVSVNTDTVVTISASKDSSYTHTVSSTPMNVTVHPALTVTSVSPDEGPIDGGTNITITGKGFLPYVNGNLVSCYTNPDAVGCASVVLDIGGTPATCQNVKVLNGTTITCTTAAHTKGLVSLKVDNGLENNTLNNAYNYVEIILNLSQANVEIAVSPVSGATFGTDVSSPAVTTNSQKGYTLTIEMTTPDQRLYSIANDEYINPVSGTWGAPTTLDANTWGYAVDALPIFSGNLFAAVPQNGISRQVINASSAPVTNQTTNITFGAKVDPLLPAGTYSGYVLYTAIVNEY